MEPTCNAEQGVFVSVLSFGLIVGLIGSYLPQIYKIIASRDSQGFSPWFLMLGSTSGAASMLNIFTMQWNVLQCCSRIGPLPCLSSIGAIIQLSLQWFLFSTIFVLFLIYYPKHLKFIRVSVTPDNLPIPTGLRTEEWRLAVALAWVTISHFSLSLLYTVFLIATANPAPDGKLPTQQMKSWATVLGVTAATLAAIQYMPQLVKTYKAKVVGALSIPMMCVQTPGGVIMVISIALREGTNWTSWIVFAVAAAMQGSLLVMCFIWKVRQKRLGIDDFGVTHSQLPEAVSDALDDEGGILPESSSSEQANGDETTDAHDLDARRANVTEQTPLLERSPTGTLHGKDPFEREKPWWKFW